MSNRLHVQVYEIRDRILSCVEAERIEVIDKISQCLDITSMIKCVFTLSKTSHPVSLIQIEKYFIIHSEKTYNWQTKKQKNMEQKCILIMQLTLGLKAKTERNVNLTPDGFKFDVQLQLHKSLKLMNNLVVN
jgi:hypothetical protein